jgi:hypothetical protein
MDYSVLKGWKVEKHDSEPSAATRYSRICGTRVTSPTGRVMDWFGRMTKKEAIRQTVEHWERDVRMAEWHARHVDNLPEYQVTSAARAMRFEMYGVAH